MTEPLLGQSDGIDPRDECNCPPNPSGDHADACLAAREFKAMKYRWCIIRSRIVGHDSDDVITLAPVGPFPDPAAACIWLDSHGYSREGDGADEWWRLDSDPFTVAEVFEAEPPDA